MWIRGSYVLLREIVGKWFQPRWLHIEQMSCLGCMSQPICLCETGFLHCAISSPAGRQGERLLMLHLHSVWPFQSVISHARSKVCISSCKCNFNLILFWQQIPSQQKAVHSLCHYLQCGSWNTTSAGEGQSEVSLGHTLQAGSHRDLNCSENQKCIGPGSVVSTEEHKYLRLGWD